MKKTYIRTLLCASALSLVSTLANSALVSRLGGLAVYDTDLDITWIANANLLSTETFGLPVGTNLGPHPSDSDNLSSGMISSLRADWVGALHWIDAMNAANYLGFNDWRLPDAGLPDAGCTSDQAGTTPSGDSTGYNCAGGEFGHLYYTELGVPAGSWIAGANADPSVSLFDQQGNPGISTFLGFPYWTSSESGAGLAMYFNPTNGRAVSDNKSFFRQVIAVRSGDVGVVPIPAAVWLFASGFLGLVGLSRRKYAA